MPDSNAWQDWVGRKGVAIAGPYPVSLASIGYLAEALQDERLAGLVASGHTAAPRSFVTILSRVPNWRPSTASGPESFMQAMLVPLPVNSGVNLGIDQKYFIPLLPGDCLESQSTIVSITPKTTKLGEGFIIVEFIEHRSRDGILVATTENVLLRFAAKPKVASASEIEKEPAETASPPPAASPPSDFPLISQLVTMTMLAKAAGAVRDFAPLHHDIELARAAGHATAFLSYSHQMSLITSAIGKWFDGDERMRRLKLSMKKPIYLGKTCVCAGVRRPAETEGVEIVEVSLISEDGICSIGLVEIKIGETNLWS